MNDLDRMQIEYSCTRLCNAFHVYVDSYLHDKVPELFAPDAVFYHMSSGTMNGPDEIAAYLDTKSTYPIVRHVITNVLIDVIDADNAKGTAYLTVYYAEPTATPAVLEPPIVLVTYEDTFCRTAQGWRFASRRPRVTHAAPSFNRLINTKDDEKRLRRN